MTDKQNYFTYTDNTSDDNDKIMENLHKQIIIDGVDVSGCAYIIPPRKQCPNKPMPYTKETSCFACKEHNTKLNFCKNNPNCYYKQLKAKEQECKELTEKLYYFINGEYCDNECNVVKELDQLKVKNSILEDEYKILEGNLDSRTRDFEDVIDNYKQTLTEIKEIAEENDELLLGYHKEWANNKIILGKISEVEE